MSPAAAAMLACPHCGSALAIAGASLRCRRGHEHDVARGGHVTLLPAGARPGGDTARMVAARERVLGAGHLDPIADAVAGLAARALAEDTPGGVVDLGAGTGHHLARVLDVLPGRAGLALDLSRAAARRAARSHPRTCAVVCDIWRRLPLKDGVAALVLDVFAPRNGPEIRRILHETGALVVVSPTPDHLGEIVGALDLLSVDGRKEERIAAALGPTLGPEATAPLAFTLSLCHRDLADLVGMGPSARHQDPSALAERIAALPEPTGVTVSVTLGLYRPRRAPPEPSL